MRERCSAKTDAEIAAFFDCCAEEGLMMDFPPGQRAKLDQFLSDWAIPLGARVLEPGCGSGRLTAELAEAVGPEGEVYACDLSGAMLRRARERALPIQVCLAQGSALEIERPDGWFDSVICLNVFPHFPEPARALAEFARVLRPGGQLWINHFEGRESLNRFHSSAAPEVSDHALPEGSAMENLMKEADFRMAQLDDCPEWYRLQVIH